MTLTYVVSCRQHRMTPHAGRFAAEAELVHCPPAGSLDAVLRGRVLRPGDDDWDAARAAWNLAVDQRPALVVEVADAFDVQAVVRYAARARPAGRTAVDRPQREPPWPT